MNITSRVAVLACFLTIPGVAFGQPGNACGDLPSHATLRATLRAVVVQAGQPNADLTTTCGQLW
jgi:hypothetical protein